MSNITTYMPDSDIEVTVEYEVKGYDNVTYSAAYIGGAELPADNLFFKDKLGNTTKLSDYFNFKLQESANMLLAAE